VAGDGQRSQCDGAGNILGVVDVTDAPDDGNQCTTDLCTAGVPGHGNAAAGTSCDQGGGTACDGNGACIAESVSVVRVGDGAAALSSSSTRVFIEKRAQDGSLLGTIALPTSSIGSNGPLTVSGSATSEGALSRSGDGRYLVLAGYPALPGIASVASASALRVIGRVDGGGVTDTTTMLSGVYSANNIRSATSVDGSAFWAGGTGSGQSGVVYATLGAASGTALIATPTNVRWTHVFNGQLFASASSGTFTNVFRVGTGTPTTPGQTATSLPGLPTSGASPYGFVLFDRSVSVAGLDTLYLADDRAVASGGGLQKWTFDGTTWALAATSSAVSGGTATGFRGLAGVASGGSVTLFATSSVEGANGTQNRLVKFVDAVPFGASSSALTGTSIATAPANTAFRGVALSPR
jgi:hypothetical protein